MLRELGMKYNIFFYFNSSFRKVFSRIRIFPDRIRIFGRSRSGLRKRLIRIREKNPDPEKNRIRNTCHNPSTRHEPHPPRTLSPGPSGHALMCHTLLELLRPGGQVHDDVRWVRAGEDPSTQQDQGQAPGYKKY